MKSESSTARIICTIDTSMHFSQSQCILITNLEFIGCGGNKVEHIKKLLINNTTFEGEGNSGTALELIETTAQIVNSTFVSNRKRKHGAYRDCFSSNFGCFLNGFNGGAVIATNSIVVISQSIFEDNGADVGGAIFAEQHSIIKMSGNAFVSNSANSNNGIGGVLLSNSSIITIEARRSTGFLQQ